MKRAIIAVVLILGCHGNSSTPTSPSSSTAALTGKVTNAVTAAPVDQASVDASETTGSTISTLTASNGTYSFFTGLQAGTVKVTVTAKGYQTFTGNTTIATGSNRYDIQLQPAP